MDEPTIKDYVFTGYNFALEDIHQTHIHRIRREPNVTYRDEFAAQIINECYPKLWEQTLEGWSRSYYTGEDHLKAIFQYGLPNIKLNPEQHATYKQAEQVVSELLRSLPRVRAFDVMTELNLVKYEASSAAGYDYIGAKGAYLDVNHDRAIRRAKATLMSAIRHDGEGIEHVIRTMVPDVGYTRTQLTELSTRTKVRGVWGRAFHYILLEGVTAQPLLDAFKQGTTFYHIGSDPTVSVPELLSKVNGECDYIMALDWQSFDATVNRFEIETAFKLLLPTIDFPNKETEESFYLSEQLFTHKKIAAPDGKIYWSHKGIPSGSYFTSLIGSIINRLRIEYVFRSIIGSGPKMCYTQGDDSLIGCDQYIHPDKIAEVSIPLGWLTNPSKTQISRHPAYIQFLGRTTHGGLNQREIKRCLRLLIFPEFPVESGRISAYRAQSIRDDAGNTSDIIERVADRLKRAYGVASEDEVPRQLKRYVM